MTAPRTPGRVSPVIPVQTPAGATLLAVVHDDHTCIALQVGRRNAIHSFRLDRRGHAALLTALLDWRYCVDELPDDETTVLIANSKCGLLFAYHADGAWWCSETTAALAGDTYAWAHVPMPPERRAS